MDKEQLKLDFLGKCLQGRRKYLGMTQEDVERKVNISYKHYSTIERGQTNPSYTHLLEIAKALDTTAASIVKEAEQEYYSYLAKHNKE